MLDKGVMLSPDEAAVLRESPGAMRERLKKQGFLQEDIDNSVLDKLAFQDKIIGRLSDAGMEAGFAMRAKASLPIAEEDKMQFLQAATGQRDILPIWDEDGNVKNTIIFGEDGQPEIFDSNKLTGADFADLAGPALELGADFLTELGAARIMKGGGLAARATRSSFAGAVGAGLRQGAAEFLPGEKVTPPKQAISIARMEASPFEKLIGADGGGELQVNVDHPVALRILGAMGIAAGAGAIGSVAGAGITKALRAGRKIGAKELNKAIGGVLEAAGKEKAPAEIVEAAAQIHKDTVGEFVKERAKAVKPLYKAVRKSRNVMDTPRFTQLMKQAGEAEIPDGLPAEKTLRRWQKLMQKNGTTKQTAALASQRLAALNAMGRRKGGEFAVKAKKALEADLKQVIKQGGPAAADAQRLLAARKIWKEHSKAGRKVTSKILKGAVKAVDEDEGVDEIATQLLTGNSKPSSIVKALRIIDKRSKQDGMAIRRAGLAGLMERQAFTVEEGVFDPAKYANMFGANKDAIKALGPEIFKSVQATAQVADLVSRSAAAQHPAATMLMLGSAAQGNIGPGAAALQALSLKMRKDPKAWAVMLSSPEARKIIGATEDSPFIKKIGGWAKAATKLSAILARDEAVFSLDEDEL
jgi:hypothetical protein